MAFISYLKIRMRIYTNRLKQNSSVENAGTVAGYIFILTVICAISYFVLKVLSQGNAENIGKFVFAFFIFLTIIAISKNFSYIYKQYFEAPDKEILLYVPISHTAIVLIRYLEALREFFGIFSFFYIPVLISAVILGKANVFYFISCIIGLLPIGILVVSLLKMLLVLSFWISKGLNLKKIALGLSGALSATVFIIIIFFSEKLSNLFDTNTPIASIVLLPIKLYANFLLSGGNSFSSNSIWLVELLLISAVAACIAFVLTNRALYYGMVVVSNESKSSTGKTVCNAEKKNIGNFIRSFILKTNLPALTKKDLLYLFGNIGSLKGIVFPIFLFSLYDYKYQFMDSGEALFFILLIVSIWISITLSHSVFVTEGSCFYLINNSPIGNKEIVKAKVLSVVLSLFPILGIFESIVFIIHRVPMSRVIFTIVWTLIVAALCSIICLCYEFRNSQIKQVGIVVGFEVAIRIFGVVLFVILPFSAILYGAYFLAFIIQLTKTSLIVSAIVRIIVPVALLIIAISTVLFYTKSLFRKVEKVMHEVY